MDVSFATRSLQRQCNDMAALVARWGPRAAGSLSRTLQELAALDRLADVADLPHVRVTGDSSGPMIVGSSDGCQIALEAADDGTARGSSLNDVRAVVVMDVAVDGELAGGRSDG